MAAHVYLTVDLGFGDAGKGSIVDYLVRQMEAGLVVRYNGGAQAGHRVVTDDGREHVFSQFGSGTLAGARTFLSRHMLLDPPAMLAEGRQLQSLGVADPFALTTIAHDALVITPFQRAVNRLRELARGDGRHGSCGMGIGETMRDFVAHGDRLPLAADLADLDVLAAKLRFVQALNRQKLAQIYDSLPDSQAVAAELAWFNRAAVDPWLMQQYACFGKRANIVPNGYLGERLASENAVVFEGAQGVLLDEWHGFHPYATWSTTTLANADRLLSEANFSGRQTRIGITRAYTTRHGAGPLVTEDDRLSQQLADARNGFDSWQHHFRVGWLDLVLLDYALQVAGRLDYLALTCLDRVNELAQIRYCDAYCHDGRLLRRLSLSPQAKDLAYQRQLTQLLEKCRPQLSSVPDVGALQRAIERRSSLPVCIRSYGPAASHKTII